VGGYRQVSQTASTHTVRQLSAYQLEPSDRVDCVTGSVDANLGARMRAVTVSVALPTGVGLDDAIQMAEELMSIRLSGAATVNVEAFPRGTVRSDADQQCGRTGPN
jgi:hypothetical protein